MGLGEEEETFWLMEDAEAEPVCAEVANSAVHTGFYLLVVGGGGCKGKRGGVLRYFGLLSTLEGRLGERRGSGNYRKDHGCSTPVPRAWDPVPQPGLGPILYPCHTDLPGVNTANLINTPKR